MKKQFVQSVHDVSHALLSDNGELTNIRNEIRINFQQLKLSILTVIYY